MTSRIATVVLALGSFAVAAPAAQAAGLSVSQAKKAIVAEGRQAVIDGNLPETEFIIARKCKRVSSSAVTCELVISFLDEDATICTSRMEARLVSGFTRPVVRKLARSSCAAQNIGV